MAVGAVEEGQPDSTMMLSLSERIMMVRDSTVTCNAGMADQCRDKDSPVFILCLSSLERPWTLCSGDGWKRGWALEQ